jgi:hypothetical protein
MLRVYLSGRSSSARDLGRQFAGCEGRVAMPNEPTDLGVPLVKGAPDAPPGLAWAMLVPPEATGSASGD